MASGDAQGSDSTDFFPTVKSVPFEGPKSHNPLAFKYYNADEVVMGRPMRDWLRFAVCYWHTWRGIGFDMFGPAGTIDRTWEKDSASLSELEKAKVRVKVNFQFMERLGVDYFCFHDRDVAPEGGSVAESNANLDAVVDVMEAEMKRTGKKLLWGTANLFSHRRYMNGAATNPNPQVFAHAAAQVKKALEVTMRLGGENYVLWGGREGYACFHNTDMKQELDHLATFLRMVRDYKNEIGFTGQLLIEPKPREPTSHQYDFDSATVMGFLRTYGLEKDFKLNLEANHATLAGHSFEHEVTIASAYGMLGSVDANHNESLLGWDTDMFPTDVKMATMIMRAVTAQGGLQPGGLNFDCKVRRESTDVEDVFIGHISGMDTFARGLRIWAQMHEDGIWDKMIAERYADYSKTPLGMSINSGTTTLATLAKWAEENAEPEQRSGKEEAFLSVLNSYL